MLFLEVKGRSGCRTVGRFTYNTLQRSLDGNMKFHKHLCKQKSNSSGKQKLLHTLRKNLSVQEVFNLCQCNHILHVIHRNSRNLSRLLKKSKWKTHPLPSVSLYLLCSPQGYAVFLFLSSPATDTGLRLPEKMWCTHVQCSSRKWALSNIPETHHPSLWKKMVSRGDIKLE